MGTSNDTISLEKSRSFRRLLMGSSVSMLGSRVTTIAFPLLILYLTRSPAIAGWAGFAATVPSVFVYIPAGALVDRWNPRLAMLISEFGRGLAIAAVLAVVLAGRPNVVLLTGIAALEESLEVFSTLAERRFMRSLVEPDQASSALGRSEARTHVVVLAGRLLGGFLFGLGPVLPFMVDVLSFVFSISVLFKMRTRCAGWRIVRLIARFLHFVCMGSRGEQRENNRRLRAEICDGLRWLFHNPFARIAIMLSPCTTLIAQALIMIFLAEAHDRHLRPLALGMVLAASGLGGTLGSLTGAGRRSGTGGFWLQNQLLVWTVALLVLALMGGGSVIFISAVMAAFGFTGALSNIELNVYLMQNVPASMLARVVSIGQVISFGTLAVGPALGGMLVQWYGVTRSIYCLLVMTACFAVFSRFLLRAPFGRVVQASGFYAG